ncbi:MAG: 1-phosphofructokinase family hexose kinase [Eubacteriales bacterium]|jgi:1-phosphofructokinase|nr:1-phosphofructokinase family hexose kinase [Eubacteriales bacterium]MDD4711411.1 1-phosphofructokinase family hexose kinase [Eubacteriales bacterium]NLO14821.1 1-phosphofructokinase family hexose kinase [Clostridiales bacterium]
MIITVTLNPALDKTLVLSELQLGKVNRVKAIRRDAGGRGLSVSKTVNALGGESVALCIIGGATGTYIRTQLDSLGIEHDMVEIGSETRTNLMIVDNLNKTHTEILEPGAPIHQMALDEILFALRSRARAGDIIVLAGTLPEGCKPDVYNDIIRFAKSIDALTYLDSDSETLALALSEKPDLIKPNKSEMAALCNCDPEDDIAILQEVKKLVKNGVGSVLLSLGPYGAIYVSDSFCLRAQGLKVPVIGRSGAGDAMMAAMALGEERGMSPKDRLKLAIAAASAKITMAGTQPPEAETVEEFLKEVVVTDMLN